MSFNQGAPGVPTLINSSAVLVTGNAASANALTVRQFGTGNVFSAQTTTGSTALFVGANGNVGVGTTNPQNNLNVVGSANVYGQLTYSTQPYLSTVSLSVAGSAAAGWYRIAAIPLLARAKFRLETYGGGIQESVCVTTTAAVAFSTGWPSVRIDDQTIFNAGNNALSGGQIRMLSSQSAGTYYLEVYLISVGAAYTLYVHVLEGDPRIGAPTLSNPIVGGSVPASYNVGPTVPVNGFSVSTSTTTSMNAALLITSSGNVGIGTTSPGSPLEVVSSSVNSEAIPLYLRNNATNTTYNTQSVSMIFGSYAGSGAGTGGQAKISGGLADALGGGFLSFSTYNSGVGYAERMRILANGNVGIGITNPGAALDVAGGTIIGAAGNTSWRIQPQYVSSSPFPSQVRITNAWDAVAGTGQANYAGVGINLNSYQGGSQVEFYTSSTNNAVPTQRMVIGSGGNVGIGTASPGYPLDINTSGNTALRLQSGPGLANNPVGMVISTFNDGSKDCGIRNSNSTLELTAPGNYGFFRGSSGNYTTFICGLLGVLTGGATTISVDASGYIQRGAVSDQRLKSNIVTMTDFGLKTITDLRPVTYDATPDSLTRIGTGTHLGLVAQEVQTIFPYAVSADQDEQQTLTIDYIKLVPVMINAFKELSAENTALKSRLDSLEARLATAGL